MRPFLTPSCAAAASDRPASPKRAGSEDLDLSPAPWRLSVPTPRELLGSAAPDPSAPCAELHLACRRSPDRETESSPSPSHTGAPQMRTRLCAHPTPAHVPAPATCRPPCPASLPDWSGALRPADS